MTIQLRAHHLLCMLTYIGRGYTPAFVANYDAIIVRLGGGETIELVDGPDDVCVPLLTEGEPHCHHDNVLERDRLARLAISDLLQTDLTRPFSLDEQVLSGLRAAFSTGQIRPACAGCEWAELCDSVAQSGYSGVRLNARLC
ncbi:DUF1284 domain-containing protein [Devosia sp. SL43]|uniref:DUF1284 domain-containing protein n=1 Tax=Devosia sp. SL43 TaxID=2806348 RepID=UPI001F2AD215|nr:DUF1284 domain-containing protein [Devosia sp. SL43]UJW85252.1 DUF1284 domain-containing protein [Devosia sp. SL43]